MSPLENGTVLLNNSACTFAFRAGQLFEKLLLDRGIERIGSSDSSIVTVETIEACVDDSLFEEFRKQLNERTERDPRKVA